MRGVPRSLFARIAAILALGLLLAYALALWSVLRERGELSRSMMLGYLGRDVAASVAMLDRLPRDERAAWLPRLARANYRYALTPAPAGPAADSALVKEIADALGAELGPGRLLRVAQADGQLAFDLRLADGSPLALTLQPPRLMVSATTAGLLLLQLALLGACIAWAVRQTTQPLAQLAHAADALGRNPEAPPLAEHGPTEARRAAAAFNTMQRRIASHLAERLQILAAVSHDLQTPITRLRMRTETMADTALRGKLQADLAEMQALVEEGLAYARSAHAAAEPAQPVDLHALLDSLVCDYTDAGREVLLSGAHPRPLTTRPQALRRVVGNLVDNALKFAGAAELIVRSDARSVHISVCDRGPGIAPDQLAAVLQPFYRIEASRNRDTGGAGLGLAIASQLTQALGGRLHLLARAGGGLEARLSLPAQ
ncbi:ATP-binding protein [Ideonella sp. BN130291]|uniref:ATP-binding protein n=1 Tax=Ideonella sp. BN130291 TaxID=3112940 RepID=UPI002E2566F1|nr:ATP-binding protein [Ideonella sp. BN130291]